MKKILFLFFIITSLSFTVLGQSKKMSETITEVVATSNVTKCTITNMVGTQIVFNEEFIVKGDFIVVVDTNKKGETSEKYYNINKFFSFYVKKETIYFNL